MDTLRSTYKVSLDNKTPEKVGLEEIKSRFRGGNYSRDFTKKVFSKNGDLFFHNLTTGSILQVTNTVESESGAAFSGDGKHILYRRGDNLYSWSLDSGETNQLTNFRKDQRRSERPLPEYQQWLKDDQFELFEILSERTAKNEIRQRQREEMRPERPLEIFIGKQQLYGMQASPDQKYVTYLLGKEANGKGTKVPSFVTESGYINDLRARTKVGTPQTTFETGIYDRVRDTSFIINTKQIPGIYDKPAYLREYHRDTVPYKSQYSSPREVIIMGPVYSEDGKAIVVIRSADNKDRWIMLLDPPTGELKLLDRQRDEAWIGGPGISSWNFSSGNIGWMPDNQRIWFQSEETGYSHIYTLDVESGEKKALTSGDFEIRDAQLSKDKKHFYITANAEGPHEQHFYHMPVEGGKMEKITNVVGRHEASLSPDEKYLAIRYSYSNKPWELYLMENKAGAKNGTTHRIYDSGI